MKKNKEYTIFIFPLGRSVGISVISSDMKPILANTKNIKSLSNKKFINIILDDIIGICAIYNIKDIILCNSVCMFSDLNKYYDMDSLITSIKDICKKENLNLDTVSPLKIFKNNCINHIEIYNECMLRFSKNKLTKDIIPGTQKGKYYSLLLGYYYLNEYK